LDHPEPTFLDLADAWRARHERVIAASVEHWLRTGTWLTVNELGFAFLRSDDEDIFEELRRIPPPLGRVERPDERLELRLRALVGVPSAAPVVQSFQHVLLLVKKLLMEGDPNDLALRGSDVVGVAHVPLELAPLVSQVIFAEDWMFGGGGGSADGTWHRTITDRTAAIRAVVTVEDYLRIEGERFWNRPANRSAVAHPLLVEEAERHELATLAATGPLPSSERVEPSRPATTGAADTAATNTVDPATALPDPPATAGTVADAVTDQTTIKLQHHEWVLGEKLGQGGMAPVFAASSAEVAVPAAAKLIPKEPGAARELLFEDLTGVPNVVSVLDSGEIGESYVLVMERAQQSLRNRLDAGPRFTEQQVLAVLADVALALQGIAERGVVHRDLKPGNVLYVNGRWCLTDFGIARYAEATTSEHTRQHMKSRQYAAPEQWREERVTAATDMYGFGVMGYELLAGRRPFRGDDLRDQHLHQTPAALADVSAPVAALISQCLLKEPGARPSATDVLRRIAVASGPPPTGGLARLQAASHVELQRVAETQRQSSEAETMMERRGRLYADAQTMFALIARETQEALTKFAPTLSPAIANDATWVLNLGGAQLKLGVVQQQAQTPGRIAFDVIAYSSLSLLARGQHGYRGRQHSLWYSDMYEEGRFSWYETAFKGNAFGGPLSAIAPEAQPPDTGADAFAPGVGMRGVAWNPRKLEPGNLEGLIERWATWLANAYEGRWAHPNHFPEEQIIQDWRQ